MTFTLELSVTEKCNLGCPYCYVANKDNFMTPEIFDEKLPLILDYMKKANCDKLNMSFFGGEPMLNFDLIKHATKKIREVLPDTQLVIISNMTMIDEEKSKWIKENEETSCSFI
jgi:uncharacterized protein